jgi:hypothetical protein
MLKHWITLAVATALLSATLGLSACESPGNNTNGSDQKSITGPYNGDWFKGRRD